MTVLDTALDPRSPAYVQSRGATLHRLAELESALDEARAGGGERWTTRHHARGKLLPRERVELLLDRDGPFLELSAVAARGTEYRTGAGVVTGLGVVEGVECVVVATDPTVDGGAVNPYTAVKIRRAARIAAANRLPLLSLVESAGAAATDDALARDLGRLAARGVPAVCVVFGATTGEAAYLPALADCTVAVRGHAAPPPMHPQPGRAGARGAAPAADQFAEDERDGLRLARRCVRRLVPRRRGAGAGAAAPPRHDAEGLLALADPDTPFDPCELLARVLDGSDFDEFRPAAGPGLLAGWGELHGRPLAVLAAPGGTGTAAEAHKAAHFLRLAGAAGTPLLFLPGPADADGPHAAGLRRAVAASPVPHLALLTRPGAAGGAAAGRGGDDQPRFAFRWPAAAGTAGGALPDDGVVDPRDTRTVLAVCLSAVGGGAGGVPGVAG